MVNGWNYFNMFGVESQYFALGAIHELPLRDDHGLGAENRPRMGKEDVGVGFPDPLRKITTRAQRGPGSLPHLRLSLRPYAECGNSLIGVKKAG